MSDKQQSAVDFLFERLERMIPKTALYNQDKRIYFDQAKELFKQQIIDAFYDGKSNGIDISHPLSSAKEIPSDQYFNDKFKNRENER